MIPLHAKQILDEIENLNYKPKGSEIGFIQSVNQLIQEDRMLSSKQEKFLTDICRRASGHLDHERKEYLCKIKSN